MKGPLPERFALVLALTLVLAIWPPVVAKAATQTTVEVGVRSNMRAELFEPDGQGPYPAVLVLHTSSGLKAADIIAARQLAGAGYVALVPACMAAYASYEMQLYPDTGHSFDRGGFAPNIVVGPRARAVRATANGGGPGNGAAEADAWTRTLAFSQKYLSPSSGSPQP